MVLDAELLARCKLYCHIDEDREDEDELLRLLIPAVESQLRGAGITEESAGEADYLTTLFEEVLVRHDRTDRMRGTQQQINAMKLAPDYVEETEI